jgi:hypothetical protein
LFIGIALENQLKGNTFSEGSDVLLFGMPTNTDFVD